MSTPWRNRCPHRSTKDLVVCCECGHAAPSADKLPPVGAWLDGGGFQPPRDENGKALSYQEWQDLAAKRDGALFEIAAEAYDKAGGTHSDKILAVVRVLDERIDMEAMERRERSRQSAINPGPDNAAR